MKTIGIVAHSAEGGSLCFLTACREGQRLLGDHDHPPVVVSAIPMGRSMPGWEADDHEQVAGHLLEGVEQVHAAGADFFVCPDNTAHIVLEKYADRFPIPGLHIAQVVCAEIARGGWTRVGLLGTEWTMSGPVYERALSERGMERLVPGEETRGQIHKAIFNELCRGEFRAETTGLFIDAIGALADRGAECVILGCTEIPLIVNAENSPLPVLDSPRLLATYAVAGALGDGAADGPWLPPRAAGDRG